MAAACTAAARMFAYNATRCACDPGYYLSNGTSCVSLPTAGGGGGAFSDWQVGAVGAGSRNQTLYFLAPVLSLDAVRRLTQSQAVVLVASLLTLLSWLAFCANARLAGRDPADCSRQQHQEVLPGTLLDQQARLHLRHPALDSQ
jgi:hypothetical protein